MPLAYNFMSIKRNLLISLSQLKGSRVNQTTYIVNLPPLLWPECQINVIGQGSELATPRVENVNNVTTTGRYTRIYIVGVCIINLGVGNVYMNHDA